MTQRWLVLGKGGLVGHALMQVLGADASGFSRDECNFFDHAFIEAVEQAYMAKPFAVLANAAGYTQVDAAESEDSGTLLRINAVAPGELAAWCAKRGVVFVHFSTDYVFDGSGDAPWNEQATPAPLNAYGMSKLMGERAVAAAGGKHLIFRTSWPYDNRGKNFLMAMRKLMAERETLQVVADQFGAPTYVPQLAKGVADAVAHAMAKGEFPSGVYHVCHGGETTWHGFAQAILKHEAFKGSPKCRDVIATTAEAYAAAAPRPANSRLNCAKAREVLGVALPDWESGLRACYAQAGGQ